MSAVSKCNNNNLNKECIIGTFQRINTRQVHFIYEKGFSPNINDCTINALTSFMSSVDEFRRIIKSFSNL